MVQRRSILFVILSVSASLPWAVLGRLGKPPLTAAGERHEDEHDLRSLYDEGTDAPEYIINGWDSNQGRFPYYVAIYRSSGSFICGGSLIAPDIVLTAAHCNEDLGKVIIGKYTSTGSSDGSEEIEIAQVYEHSSWNRDTKQYDQMLLKLKSQSSHAYLKNVNADNSVPATQGTQITVIGLGTTNVKENTRPSVLQQFTASYLPNSQCAASSTKDYSYTRDVKDDHLCLAGSGGQCYGDSGGPVILMGSTADEDIQVGIVSWGVDCGTQGLPSVASRTAISTWIKDTTCALSAAPPSGLCGSASFNGDDRSLTSAPVPSAAVNVVPAPSAAPTWEPTSGPTGNATFVPSGDVTDS